jgi:hypothetical protein
MNFDVNDRVRELFNDAIVYLHQRNGPKAEERAFAALAELDKDGTGSLEIKLAVRAQLAQEFNAARCFDASVKLYDEALCLLEDLGRSDTDEAIETRKHFAFALCRCQTPDAEAALQALDRNRRIFEGRDELDNLKETYDEMERVYLVFNRREEAEQVASEWETAAQKSTQNLLDQLSGSRPELQSKCKSRIAFINNLGLSVKPFFGEAKIWLEDYGRNDGSTIQRRHTSKDHQFRISKSWKGEKPGRQGGNRSQGRSSTFATLPQTPRRSTTKSSADSGPRSFSPARGTPTIFEGRGEARIPSTPELGQDSMTSLSLRSSSLFASEDGFSLPNDSRFDDSVGINSSVSSSLSRAGTQPMYSLFGQESELLGHYDIHNQYVITRR